MGDLALIRRLFFQARPYWAHIAGLIGLRFLAIPLALLMPIPLKIAVDSVIGSDPIPSFLNPVVPGFLEGSNLRLLALAATLQVLIVLLAQIQEIGAYVVRSRAAQGLALGMRSRLFAHMERLSLLYHDTQGTGDSVYRIQNDAPAIRDIATNSVIPTIASIAMLAAMLYVIVRIDWQLAAVALAVSPVLFVLGRQYNRRMRGRYREAWRMENLSIRMVQEALAAFRVVVAFGREDTELERFEGQAKTAARRRIRLAFAEGLFGLLINVSIAGGTAAVLYIGTRNVLSGTLTLGELLVVLAYITQLFDPLRTIARQTASLQSSLVSAERAFEVLDEVPDVRDRPDALKLDRAVGKVEFNDVGFSYARDVQVLRNVSFTLESGTRLGISGRTGAGKTTLMSLLARFYDPTRGRVLIDGVDLKDYRLDDLRRQFAIVLQEPVLFSTTVAENIRYGRPDATQSQVEEAARAANIHEFIVGLPDGFETLVGERGMKLSGGERQRIALARAFLKDAPLLILDEPTSSVDIETESAIIDAMERLMQGRTTFMIAHRLSTLESCNARLEIEDGRIISASGDIVATVVEPAYGN